MSKIGKFFTVVGVGVIIFSSGIALASFSDDWRYYQKLSAEKNLSVNDRLYLLHRLANKYRSDKKSFDRINAEISRLRADYKKGQKLNPSPDEEKEITDFQKITEDNYKIESGDVLQINVYPAKELSQEAVVQPDGTVSLPLAGSVLAAGMTTAELAKSVAEKLSRYVANPQVSVNVKQFSGRYVYIIGEVKTVGSYPYKKDMRLLDLISASGGFTDGANRKEIKVYRGKDRDKKTYTVNIEDIIKTGNFANDFVLQPQDTVEVPRGRIQVAVLGEVKNPGYYDWHENLKLVELLSLAGGFSNASNITAITILRVEGSKTIPIKVNLKKILSGDSPDIIIKSQDTVYVPQKAIASASWLISTIFPLLSLISIILVIRSGLL